jgi:hypothetical protein
MFKNAKHVVNVSGNTPSASEHTERVAKEQNQEVNQQKLTQVKQDTDLPYQPGPSGYEHAASHLDGTPSQMDGIIAHDNIFTTRNATYNHDHDHIPLGDEVDDTTFPTVKQILNGKYYALGGVENGQDDLLAMNGRRSNSEAKSDDQVRDEAAPTMKHTLHGNKFALGICSAHQAAQSDETHGHAESSTSVNDHTNASPTILATLQDQVYAPIEGPIEVLKKHLNADSHKLAYEAPEARGAIQTEYPNGSNAEVTRDIGWHKANIEIPDPLIGGYTNGELFSFLRRFNKVGLLCPDETIHGLICG